MRTLVRRLALAAALASVPAVAHAAATLEILPHYSPVVRTGTILSITYASPSFEAYQANAMNALVNGLDAFGPEGSPTRFERFDRSTFSIYETTATPFNSWLGDATPEGAFAGEYGTLVREAVRVESDTAFRLGDIAYRYQDDQGFDFSRTLAALGVRFSPRAIGRLPDGTLIQTSLGSAAADAAVELTAFYYLGLAFINVAGPYTRDSWAATGRSPASYFEEINLLYLDDPYSFSDSWTLTVRGELLASDVFAGDIVETPAPAALALFGLTLVAVALRRRSS